MSNKVAVVVGGGSGMEMRSSHAAYAEAGQLAVRRAAPFILP